MKIDEIDPDYETVKVDQIGIVDSHASRPT